MNDTETKVWQEAQPQSGVQSQNGVQPQVRPPQPVAKPKTLYDTEVKENFHIFGVASFCTRACMLFVCIRTIPV